MASKRICLIPACGNKVYGHGYCSTHYQRWRRHGDPLGGGLPKRKKITQNYLRDVALLHEGDGCLLWPFGKSKQGYGVLHIDGKNETAHSAVCRLAHGEPAPGLEVRHLCGVRACVSPKHLVWGTHRDNMKDKVAHGTAPRGRNNGHAKLTEANVRWIRDFGAQMPRTKVAAMFGVSPQLIGKVVLRRVWEWLE